MDIEAPSTFIGILIAVIMALVGPVLVVLVTHWLQNRSKRQSRKIHIKAYEGNQKIDNILDEISSYPGVKKAVLIQNTNGGGIPQIGHPIYSSIISPQRWRKYWENQLIDREYEEITLKILKQGNFKIHFNNLKEGSLLKTIFRTQDILYSYVEEIEITEKGYIFISIDYYLDEIDIPVEVIDKIRIGINQIRNLYKEGK